MTVSIAFQRHTDLDEWAICVVREIYKPDRVLSIYSFETLVYFTIYQMNWSSWT